MALFIAALLFILVLIIILVRPSGVIYIKLLSVPALCIIFILCLILLSGTAVKAAQNGLNLWAGVVVPSLFPFFVAAEIMNSTGFIRASGSLLEPVMRPFFNVPGSGSFALAMGVTSGYPVGAKITCDFRKSGDLTKTEAERLLAFTNNSGPLFIVGAVGTGMYGSPRLGIFLFIFHFLACITVGFIFRFYKAGRKSKIGRISGRRYPAEWKNRRSNCENRLSRRENRPPLAAAAVNPFRAFRRKLLDDHNSTGLNFGTILGDAIRNSVSTILAIGGFIVLFSVIIYLLSDTGVINTFADVSAYVLSPLGIDKTVIKGLLSGLFEITTGSGLVGAAAGIPLYQQLPAASFIIGWAGLSVHFQVMSIAAKTDISIRPYLLGKLLQGIISAMYTWIGLKLFRLDVLFGAPVLGNSLPLPSNLLHYLGTAIWMLSAVLVVFAAFAIIGRFKAGLSKL